MGIWVVLYAAGVPVADESGPMENLQVLCLGVGAALFTWKARGTRRRAERLLYLALALFFVSFLLREIDAEDFRLPQGLIELLDGRSRAVWLGALWLVVLMLFLRQAQETWSAFLRWVGTRAGRLLLVGGLAYVLAWPLDKRLILIPRPTLLFLEELVETAATLLMLFSAVATYQLRTEPQPSPTEAVIPDTLPLAELRLKE